MKTKVRKQNDSTCEGKEGRKEEVRREMTEERRGNEKKEKA